MFQMTFKAVVAAVVLTLASVTAQATADFECSFKDGLKIGGFAPRMAGSAPFVTYIELADGKGHQIPQTQVQGFVEKKGKIISFSFKALGTTFRYNKGTLTRNGRSSKGRCSFP